MNTSPCDLCALNSNNSPPGGAAASSGGRQAAQEDRRLRVEAERVPARLHQDEVLPVQVPAAVRVPGPGQQHDHQHGGRDAAPTGLTKKPSFKRIDVVLGSVFQILTYP